MSGGKITLREYLDGRITELDRVLTERIAMQAQMLAAAQAAAESAAAAADRANERRLDLLNEFRAQSKDEQATFVPRETFDSRNDAIAARLQKVEAEIAVLQGRLIGFTAAGALFGGAVAEAISHLFGR